MRHTPFLSDNPMSDNSGILVDPMLLRQCLTLARQAQQDGLARRIEQHLQAWATDHPGPLASPEVGAQLESSPPRRVAAPATKLGAPITERMAQTLQAMIDGAVVEADITLGWPRWKVWPKASSMAAPNHAMLVGMRDRGLLQIERHGANPTTEMFPSVITISDLGRQALDAWRLRKARKRPGAYKRFVMHFSLAREPGRRRQETVVARSEEEARSKLLKRMITPITDIKAKNVLPA